MHFFQSPKTSQDCYNDIVMLTSFPRATESSGYRVFSTVPPQPFLRIQELRGATGRGTCQFQSNTMASDKFTEACTLTPIFQTVKWAPSFQEAP